MILSPSMALALAFLCGLHAPAFAQEPGLPSDIGKTCLNRSKNAVAVNNGLRDPKAAQACKEQVVPSYDLCGEPPKGNLSGSGDASIAPGATNLMANLEVVQTANTEKAAQCSTEKAQVSKKCGEEVDRLNKEFENNKTEAENAAASSHGLQRNQILMQHAMKGREILDKREATKKLKAAGERALTDLARCYSDHARTAEFNSNKIKNETLAHAQAAEVSTANPEALKPQAVQPSEGKHYTGIAQGAVETESRKAALRTVAARTGLAAAASGSAAGRIAGNLAWGATTGPVGAAAMAAGFVVIPQPAGTCSEVYATALRADAAGCPMRIQSATQALRTP